MSNRKLRKKTILLGIVFLVTAIAAAVILYAVSPGLLAGRIEKDYASEQYQDALDRSIKLMTWFPASREAREAAYRIMQQIGDGYDKVIIGQDFTFRSGSGSGQTLVDRESFPNLYGTLRQVADRQRNMLWRWNMYERIGETALLIEDFPAAEEFLLQALDGFEEERSGGFRQIQIYLTLTELQYALHNHEQAKVYAALADSTAIQNPMLKAEAKAWLGMLLVEEERYTEAALLFEQAKELVHESLESLESLDSFEYPEDSESRDSSEAQKSSGTGSLPERAVANPEDQKAYSMAERGLKFIEAAVGSAGLTPEEVSAGFGQVTVAVYRFGRPLAGVEALLRPEAHSGSYSSRMFDTGAYRTSESGNDGVIAFSRVEPGKYDLIFRFDPDALEDVGAFQIPDTVEVEAGDSLELSVDLNTKVMIIEPREPVELAYGEQLSMHWEPYPEADYYGIHAVYYYGESDGDGGVDGVRDHRFTSSVGTVIRKVSNNSLSIDTASADDHTRIGIFSPDRVYPAAVIGLFHPGALLSLRVSAYTRTGHLLSDSEGLIYNPDAVYPLWEITEPADPSLLSAGDRLLLAGAYAEALEVYRKAAEAGDIEALASADALERSLDFNITD
jgi:tetratricopeptide (TPR) repeat protein